MKFYFERVGHPTITKVDTHVVDFKILFSRTLADLFNSNCYCCVKTFYICRKGSYIYLIAALS
jgi:hypothetical protein